MVAVAGIHGKMVTKIVTNSISPGIRVGGNRTKSLHAEAAVDKRVQSNARGLTMYVVRLGGHGTSMPCASCIRTLFNKGYRYVVFTIDGVPVCRVYITLVCVFRRVEKETETSRK